MGNKHGTYELVEKCSAEDISSNQTSTSDINDNVVYDIFCSKVKKLTSKNDIEDLFKNTNKAIIIKFYNKDAIQYFKKDNDRSKILASLMPKDSPLLNLYIKHNIRSELLYLMKDKLIVDKSSNINTEILYYYDNGNIDYIMDLLKYDIITNVSNQWCRTFLMDLLARTTDRSDLEIIIDFVKKVADTNYNFSAIDNAGSSLLTFAMTDLLVEEKKIDLVRYYLYKLLFIEKYDVTFECGWLRMIIDKCPYQMHNWFYGLVNRSDYKRLLYNIYTNYQFPTCEDDFIFIICKLNAIWKNKLLEMLNYQDVSTGNTILHLIAVRHHKKLLYYLLDQFPNLKADKNNKGETPHDIYVHNKITNKLHIIQ